MFIIFSQQSRPLHAIVVTAEKQMKCKK